MSNKKTQSKWGNPRHNQVWVEGYYSQPHSKVIPASHGLFGLWKNPESTYSWVEEAKVNGAPPDDFPDDVYVRRRFVHTCGIIKVIQCVASQSIRWNLWLDGYQSLVLSNVTIMYCAELLDGNDAIAEITIEGYGERYGTLNRSEHHVKLVFKDQQAMRKYCQAVIIQNAPTMTPSKPPSTTIVAEESSDLWPFVAGAIGGMVLGGLLSGE
jgi:hypothetical protein